MYKTARQIDPDLNVIVITGYPDSEILDRILQVCPVTVLKKPEFLIGGYTEPEGARKHFGALLEPQNVPFLTFRRLAGAVGTKG